jgi:transposase
MWKEKIRASKGLSTQKSDAQVDFGVMEAVQDGELVDIHTLVMSFPYSNAGFASQNQECFLYGLKQLFHQIGGVPRRIRIDNLTPTVKKTRSIDKEAELTEEFLRFQSHYGFEVQVCNPHSGHEKGNVENKVGYIRYNFFNKAPVMNSYEDLTDQLFQKLNKDRDRLHYEKQVRIEDLWLDEKNHLLVLPEKDYPVWKTEFVRVNKYVSVKSCTPSWCANFMR